MRLDSSQLSTAALSLHSWQNQSAHPANPQSCSAELRAIGLAMYRIVPGSVIAKADAHCS
jgi:hypothetical protein